MANWPSSTPEDLERRLKATLSQRNAGPAEIWGEFRDWLVKHGVEPTESVPGPKRFGDDGPVEGKWG